MWLVARCCTLLAPLYVQTKNCPHMTVNQILAGRYGVGPYVFVPRHLFALIHKISHSNSFYLILLVNSYDTISDQDSTTIQSIWWWCFLKVENWSQDHRWSHSIFCRNTRILVQWVNRRSGVLVGLEAAIIKCGVGRAEYENWGIIRPLHPPN